MSFAYTDLLENLVESVLSFGGFGSMLGIVSYVFCALSLYTIAQRRGIRKPWLAWVPVVNAWILGSISDQYRYVVRGEVRNKRKVLLTVNVLACVLNFVAFVLLVGSLVVPLYSYDPGRGIMEMLQLVLKGLLFFIPAWILGLVGLVFEILALYDVYTSCEPENNVLYLILSIIPGLDQITKPLFLFLCRDQDRGMPPRRETGEEI